ncbi:MAG TPA: heterodisulfide reductase-related iron-sulfur binding cluster, partial [Chlamydiales bacterium]|nr:heterodisulfide reductase-related iron-sulfur binding cluster [Chlamydiales bacterium]
FSLFGISRKRSLPSLATTPFSSQFISHKKSDKKVVLFNDTFTEFITPEIGLKAANILEAMGFEVIVPAYQCCGRTLISKGFLEQAKEKATKLVDLLFPFADENIPIIGLEPSCLLTLKDEFRDLYLDKHKVDRIIQSATTIDEFLSIHKKSLKEILRPFPKTVLLHGHCHQKALVGMQPTLQVLHCIPEAKIEEIPSGCCGMAGSFGYEKEHYAISQKMGELELFPAIRNQKDATIVASGTSCRSQILDGTERRALHLVELLDLCRKSG